MKYKCRTIPLLLIPSTYLFLNFSPVDHNHFLHFQAFGDPQTFQLYNLDTSYAVAVKAPYPIGLFYFSHGVLMFPTTVRFMPDNKVVKAFLKLFDRAAKTVSFGHYNIIQFVGFRYRQRWFRTAEVLKFRLGYNSKVWFKTPFDFSSAIRKISPKKRTHFYFSFNLEDLRWLTHAIHRARPATLYKGRGVNLKEQPMVLHDGKKAIW